MRLATELFRDSVHIFQKRIVLFFLVWVIPASISVAVLYVFPEVDESIQTTASFDIQKLLAMLGSAFAGVLSYIAIMRVAIYPESTTVADAYTYALKHFLSYIWISLLVGLAMVLGFLFFIIPGIIVSVWYSFAVYVLVVEGKTGTLALTQSHNYVRGKWSIMFRKIIFISVLTILAYCLIFIPLFLFSFNLEGLLSSILATLLSFFTIPIATIYLYLLYCEARREYETTHATGEQVPTPPVVEQLQ